MADEDETDEAKAARKKAMLDALRKNQTEIPAGTHTVTEYSDQTVNRAPVTRERSNIPDKQTETKPSPPPKDAPLSAGAQQAGALRQPAAVAKSFDTMSMDELAKEPSLGAKAAYQRRKAKGDK